MDHPATGVVLAARDGDPAALDRLVTWSMPLLYTVVGRALDGHADVDDVVQESLLRALRGLDQLRDPGSYRSWLVAIALRLVRERYRRGRRTAPLPDLPDDLLEPAPDFADATILELGLADQRREVIAATRWLDPQDRPVLAVWWLEAMGELSRDEAVAALGVPRGHAAVQLQRVRGRLEAARTVVRALGARPRCPELARVLRRWDGRPSVTWRRRISRHVSACGMCPHDTSGLVPVERLLVRLTLVPVPVALAARIREALVPAEPPLTPATATSRRSLRRSSPQAHGSPALAAKPMVAAVSVLVAAAVVGTAAMRQLHDDAAVTGATVAAAAATAAETAVPQATTATGTAATAPVRHAAPSARPRLPSRTTPGHRPAPPAAPPSARTPRWSPKKGVGSSDFPGVRRAMTAAHVAWFYNWSPSPQRQGVPGVEFVPMIWGAGQVDATDLATAERSGRTLLGFNEPDRPDQANLSVAQALDLWPKLMATGMRLGSPAVSWGADTPGTWLDQFMRGARARGYRVDFITVHAYEGTFSDRALIDLRGYLQRTYRRWHKPIWVTEYAMVDFGHGGRLPPTSVQAHFASASVALLDRLPYVERYAWFALPATGGIGTGLYTAGGRPTTVGRAYAAAGRAR